jgi:hypothetical protein
MHTPADQINVDDKINRFMTRKTSSLWSNFSRTLTGHWASKSRNSVGSDISYEPLEWNRTDSVVRHLRLQKAH